MAHQRLRFLEKQLKHSLSWSSSVSLVGMRQTGKTTLIKKLSKSYLTFDDDSLPAQFNREGDAILNQGPFPLALDEVQKYPPLFDRIKMVIDQRKTPGRYLLSGSIRFNSKKAIRESLTGRTVSFELFPMSLAECHEKSTQSFSELAIREDGDRLLRSLEERSWATYNDVNKYNQCGGLPGICFRREDQIRDKLFNQHLDTLLGRDLQFLYQTELPQDTLRTLFAILASNQGSVVTAASLARELSISATTVNKLLRAYEGLFLIRKLDDAYYSEDQGLAYFANKWLDSSNIRKSIRSQILGVVHGELRCQIAQQDDIDFKLSSFKTRGGAAVPFVMLNPKGISIAMTLDSGEFVTEKSLKSLTILSKKYKSKLRKVAIHQGTRAYLSSNGTACIPMTWIF